MINPAVEKYMNEHRDEFHIGARPGEPNIPDGRYCVDILSATVNGDASGVWLEWTFRCRDSSGRVFSKTSRICTQENLNHLVDDLYRCGVSLTEATATALHIAAASLIDRAIHVTVAPNNRNTRRDVYINRLLEVSK